MCIIGDMTTDGITTDDTITVDTTLGPRILSESDISYTNDGIKVNEIWKRLNLNLNDRKLWNFLIFYNYDIQRETISLVTTTQAKDILSKNPSDNWDYPIAVLKYCY